VPGPARQFAFWIKVAVGPLNVAIAGTVAVTVLVGSSADCCVMVGSSISGLGAGGSVGACVGGCVGTSVLGITITCVITIGVGVIPAGTAQASVPANKTTIETTTFLFIDLSSIK